MACPAMSPSLPFLPLAVRDVGGVGAAPARSLRSERPRREAEKPKLQTYGPEPDAIHTQWNQRTKYARGQPSATLAGGGASNGQPCRSREFHDSDSDYDDGHACPEAEGPSQDSPSRPECGMTGEEALSCIRYLKETGQLRGALESFVGGLPPDSPWLQDGMEGGVSGDATSDEEAVADEKGHGSDGSISDDGLLPGATSRTRARRPPEQHTSAGLGQMWWPSPAQSLDELEGLLGLKDGPTDEGASKADGQPATAAETSPPPPPPPPATKATSKSRKPRKPKTKEASRQPEITVFVSGQGGVSKETADALGESKLELTAPTSGDGRGARVTLLSTDQAWARLVRCKQMDDEALQAEQELWKRTRLGPGPFGDRVNRHGGAGQQHSGYMRMFLLLVRYLLETNQVGQREAEPYQKAVSDMRKLNTRSGEEKEKMMKKITSSADDLVFCRPEAREIREFMLYLMKHGGYSLFRELFSLCFSSRTTVAQADIGIMDIFWLTEAWQGSGAMHGKARNTSDACKKAETEAVRRIAGHLMMLRLQALKPWETPAHDWVAWVLVAHELDKEGTHRARTPVECLATYIDDYLDQRKKTMKAWDKAEKERVGEVICKGWLLNGWDNSMVEKTEHRMAYSPARASLYALIHLPRSRAWDLNDEAIKEYVETARRASMYKINIAWPRTTKKDREKGALTKDILAAAVQDVAAGKEAAAVNSVKLAAGEEAVEVISVKLADVLTLGNFVRLSRMQTKEEKDHGMIARELANAKNLPVRPVRWVALGGDTAHYMRSKLAAPRSGVAELTYSNSLSELIKEAIGEQAVPMSFVLSGESMEALYKEQDESRQALFVQAGGMHTLNNEELTGNSVYLQVPFDDDLKATENSHSVAHSVMYVARQMQYDQVQLGQRAKDLLGAQWMVTPASGAAQ